MSPTKLSLHAHFLYRFLFLFLVWLAAAPTARLHAQQESSCDPTGLVNTVPGTSATGTQLDVVHRDDPASIDHFETAWAEEARDALLAGSNSMSGSLFPEPFSDEFPLLETKIFKLLEEPIVVDSTVITAAAFSLSGCINIDADYARLHRGPGLDLEQTLHHELFHNVQRRFVAGLEAAASISNNPTNPGRLGAWVSEGQAALLPDRLSLSADWFLASRYRERVARYLREESALPLTEANYLAALFWSYACEQLGAAQSNPLQGVDFVRSFWVSLQNRGAFDSVGAFEARLQALERNPLAGFFHDFAIALYTHDLADPGPQFRTPERYRFLDALDPTVLVPALFDGTAQSQPVPYEPVARECFCVATNGCPSFEVPTDACPGISFPFHRTSDLEARQDCLEDSTSALAACVNCVATNDVEDCNTCASWKASCAASEKFFVKGLASEHIEFNVSLLGPKPCIALDLRARACAPVYWSLVTVDRTNSPRHLWTERGEHFARTLTGVAEQDLGRLTLVVSGWSIDTPFEVWLDEVELSLSILQPLTNQPARPGPGNAPGTFLVRLDVGGPLPVPAATTCDGEASSPAGVSGLRLEDFSVALTDASGFRAAASVASVSFIGGQHVLTVTTPGNLENKLYDLEVTILGSNCAATTAVVTDGVLFSSTIVNHLLVLDASSSMGTPANNTRLAAAQNAARLYVDAVGSRDRVGLVVFRGDDNDCRDNSATLLPLTEATAAFRGGTGTAALAINGITASGFTSIGDGVARARTMLQGAAEPGQALEMIVLSDGIENEGRFLFYPTLCRDTSVLDPATENWDEDNISVSVIGLGPGCDEGLLNQLSLQGAESRLPWFVNVEDGGGGSGGGGAFSDALSLRNRLSDAFLRSLERATRRERLAFATRRLSPGVTTTIPLNLEIAPGAQDGMFFFKWDEPASVTIRLLDPSGRELAAGAVDRFESTTHLVMHLRARTSLTPGAWSVEVTSPRELELITGCLARDPESLRVSLDINHGPGAAPQGPGSGIFEQGLPVTLLATITDQRGRVRGADVVVTVETPSGKALGGMCNNLRLLDDGAHEDGEANDGVYGLVFRQTVEASEGGTSNDGPGEPIEAGQRGSYIVVGTASGRTGSGTEFSRSIETHFHVRSSEKDSDGDGMIDSWERYYGTKWQVADGNEDPDFDGLFNRNEYLNGTDPLNADTDGNGEIDSSEMRRGRCPIDPSDDAIPQPVDVEVVKSDFDVGPPLQREGTLLLRFPVTPGQASLRIFRAVGKASNPFTLLATLSGAALQNALHHDESVSPGKLYFYRFQAVGADGAESTLSRIVHGSLPGEPGPVFDAVLNNGATVIDNLAVNLRLVSYTRAKLFRIASRPLTGKEPLQAVTARPFPFSIEAPRTRPALVYVYIELYDANGNASGVQTRSVVFDPQGDLDGDRIINSRDPDDDQDGLDDEEEITMTGTNPADPDTDGDGDLDGDDPGPLDPKVRSSDGTPRFLRADANTDGRLDLSDAVTILGYLFLGTAVPECQKSADADDSSRIDITDAVYILDYLFVTGRPPPPPGLVCGTDPTADRLSCDSHRSCR